MRERWLAAVINRVARRKIDIKKKVGSSGIPAINAHDRI